MTAVQYLSDEELLKKLKEIGITSPVTASTRPLLIRKLTLAQKKNKASTHKKVSRQSLQSMSSDEEGEAEHDELENGEGDLLQSSYTSQFSESKIVSKRGESSLTPSRTNTPTSSFVKRTSISRHATPSKLFPVVSPKSNDFGRKPKYDYDTCSDSDDPVIERRRSPRNRFNADKSELQNGHYQNSSLTNFSRNNYELNNLEFSTYDYSADDTMNSLNFRSSNHLAPSSFRSSLNNNWRNDKFSTPTKEKSSPLAKKFSSTIFKKLRIAWDKVRQHGIPTLLVVLLLLFFGVLAVSYFNMLAAVHGGQKIDSSTYKNLEGRLLEQDGLKLLICSENPLPDEWLCLDAKGLSIAYKVLPAGRDILKEAEVRSEEYQCGAQQFNYLTTAELNEKLSHSATISEDECSEAVVALAKLSALNPALKLEPVYRDMAASQSLLGIRVRSPKIKFLCAVMFAFSFLAYAVLMLGLGVGVFCGVTACVRRWQKNKDARKQQMFNLVSKVLELVETSDSIAVEHVRDHLFTPEERLAHKSLWKEVVHFIDSHESRVSKDIRVVGGEECEVWRWISQKRERKVAKSAQEKTPSIYPKLPSDEEMSNNEDDSTSSWWQGSAVSRKNSAVNPPTRCLKIRNVPTDSHSAEDIRKALLSKCKGLPILHLAVNQDGAEGVVYVMADRIATAGVIHSLLHGKWFVGQLLSVKFLREERYEQRFPASAQCTLPIEA